MSEKITAKQKALSIEGIKNKMLAYRDFYGGDIMYTDEIEKAKSKKELAAVMDKYRHHLEMMAIDAQTRHENFKTELGLDYA